MTKQITTVKTVIDGQSYTFKGKLTKDGKTLNLSKGMILHICEKDEVITEEVEIKNRGNKTQVACPFDMHKFFKATKQI